MIVNSFDDDMLAMREKMASIALGMTPRSSFEHVCGKALPIVYVFPDPVCPYANTVALYPLNSPSTNGATHSS